MFVNAHLLWALPLALIPVVIYYLMRFRSLRVPWGANYVLELALARLRQRLYLDQFILLALRVLACVALIAAFARPVAHRTADRVHGTGVHHILVVDQSYSLLARDANGRPQWEQQHETLRRLVGTWGRGERWSVLAAGETPKWLVRQEEITSPAKSQAVLELLAPVEQASSLAQALTTALDVVGEQPAEIFVATDDQASAWENVGTAPPPRSPPPMVWLRTAPRSRQNLAVTALAVRPETVLAGHPCRVEVKVRNYGTEPVAEVLVELLADGRFLARQSVALLAGQETQLEFRAVLETPGAHYLTARLPDDVLPLDNEMHAGVDVRDRLRVLVCRDRERNGKFDSAAEFLKLAADVLQRQTGDHQPLFAGSPWVVADYFDGDAPAALRQADAVVVDSGSRLTPELAANLAALVADGGVVMLAPDSTATVEQWNQTLGPAGLLPARLASVGAEPVGGERCRKLAGSALQFYAWVNLEPDPERATVRRTFTDGSPFAVAFDRRPGNVLLLAAGLNGRVNNLIVSRDCLPVLAGLFSEAAALGAWPRSLPPATPVSLRVREPQTVTGVTFQLEGDAAIPVTPGPVLRVPEGAAHSGLASFLLLTAGEPTRIWYGIQGRRTDSDLTPLAPAREAALRDNLGLVSASSWNELEMILQRGRHGREWQPWLLAVLLLVLAGAMLMEWRFV
jgi:hypothetical protein